jgi:hypothetical protein
MKAKRHSRAELYGTSQVAKILNIPEWRVKNFSEGAAYRLPPAHRVGRGRGSRRLYDWADIFRIAIANHLVEFGFTAEAVGRAVREIPESVLGPYVEMLRSENPDTEGLSASETPLLVSTGYDLWQVRNASKVGKEIRHALKHTERSRGIFVLNLATFCDEVFSQLHDYWGRGT